MNEIVTEGVPYKGKIIWDNESEWNKYLEMHNEQRLRFNVQPVSRITEKARMYNYYHKAVLSAAMEEFTRAGFECVDKVLADNILKATCAKDIVLNKETGEELVFTLDKRDMNQKRLLKYIVDCIHFLEFEYRRIVLSGEEWKRKLPYN